MPSIDESWVVTTDCMLIFPHQRHDQRYEPVDRLACTVTAAAATDRRSFSRLTVELLRSHDSDELDYLRHVIWDQPTQDQISPFESWPMSLELLSAYISQRMLRDTSHLSPWGLSGLQTGATAVLLNDIWIPEFGSPPKDWKSLGQTLGATTAGSGATVALATQGDGVLAVVAGLSITLLIKITYPVADALGDGLANVVRRRFGSPGDSGSSS